MTSAGRARERRKNGWLGAPVRVVSRRAWFFARHRIEVEAALVVAFYGVYQLARALTRGSRTTALHHAHEIVKVERSLHLFVEPSVQRLAADVPGLLGVFGVAYLTLHLLVTAVTLTWLWARRPAVFPAIRTALMLASGAALLCFLADPTAPPRFAGLGDVVSRTTLDMNHGLIDALYNPYAAMPSVHTAYAVIVGFAAVRYADRASIRLIGALYPLLVALMIIATGNHFLFDVVGGCAVAAVAVAASALLRPRSTLVLELSNDGDAVEGHHCAAPPDRYLRPPSRFPRSRPQRPPPVSDRPAPPLQPPREQAQRVRATGRHERRHLHDR